MKTELSLIKQSCTVRVLGDLCVCVCVCLENVNNTVHFLRSQQATLCGVLHGEVRQCKPLCLTLEAGWTASPSMPQII